MENKQLTIYKCNHNSLEQYGINIDDYFTLEEIEWEGSFENSFIIENLTNNSRKELSLEVGKVLTDVLELVSIKEEQKEFTKSQVLDFLLFVEKHSHYFSDYSREEILQAYLTEDFFKDLDNPTELELPY